jgi:hypothetical protein
VAALDIADETGGVDEVAAGFRTEEDLTMGVAAEIAVEEPPDPSDSSLTVLARHAHYASTSIINGVSPNSTVLGWV